MSEPALWQHQEQGVQQLLHHDRWALWWDPGVGKTAPLAVAGRKVGGRQLWIVPAMLRAQVAREAIKFRGDGAPVQIISTGRDRLTDATVVVCSYELARQVPIWRQLFGVTWGSLVCDEAHRLSNTGAVQTHAVYGSRPDAKAALYRAAEHVWLSTGTPIRNHPDGLFSHFSRLWPHLGPRTKREWIERYCVVQRDFFGERVVGTKNHEELRQLLRKSGSRVKLTDVHDMPGLIVDELPIDGEALDLSGYDDETLEVLETALAETEQDERGWALETAEGLAPSIATLRRQIALAKADTVARMIVDEVEAGADRVLVFGCHIEALTRVAEKTGGGLVIGSTPHAVRDSLVLKFEAGELPVLVGNVQAMGTGLNLQAGRRMFFLDASWAPSENEQAIGRQYRAGQTRPVHATFVSLQGSVDERVQGALARKATAIRRVVD